MRRPLLTLETAYGGEVTTNKMILQRAKADIRVAIPGIITKFDVSTQTVNVQPALMEQTRSPEDGKVESVKLPVLLDVPIVMPRSGGYSLTMPVVPGDECLVIFADMCIDNWWASGGVQTQDELRRHDLSDGFAILGVWSQARKVTGYNTNRARLVHEGTGAGVEVANGSVELKGEVSVYGQTLYSYIASIVASMV